MKCQPAEYHCCVCVKTTLENKMSKVKSKYSAAEISNQNLTVRSTFNLKRWPPSERNQCVSLKRSEKRPVRNNPFQNSYRGPEADLTSLKNRYVIIRGRHRKRAQRNGASLKIRKISYSFHLFFFFCNNLFAELQNVQTIFVV